MRPESDETDEEAVALCPGCFHELVGDPDYCPGCNAPVGMFTLIDPLRQAKADAYIFRRGAEHPNRPLLQLGMMALGGTYLLGAITMVLLVISDIMSEGFSGSIGLLALAALYGAFGIAALYKTMRNAKSASDTEHASD